MFCQKCGKEISNDTKFCNFCGAEQNVASTAPITSQNTTPTLKNNTKLIVIALVVVVAFILGVFVIAPSLSGNKKGIPTSSSSNTLTGNVDTDNDMTKPSVSSESSSTTLESLVPANSDDHIGDVYSASLGEGGIFTVSFGYFLDSPKVIDDFIGSI